VLNGSRSDTSWLVGPSIASRPLQSVTVVVANDANKLHDMIVLVTGQHEVAAAVVLRHNKLVHARGSPPPIRSL